MYSIINFLKFAEEDKFNEGCDPDTAMTSSVDITFEAETIDEVSQKVRDFFGVTNDSIEFNACDDYGRIDIQIMENKAGDQPTQYELDEWKAGNRRMWACTYTGVLVSLKPCRFE